MLISSIFADIKGRGIFGTVQKNVLARYYRSSGYISFLLTSR
jgi:hypothetical protein